MMVPERTFKGATIDSTAPLVGSGDTIIVPVLKEPLRES